MNEITAEVLKNVVNKQNIGDIGEIVNGLFPSVYIIIATVGAFIITLLILSKFLYGPVKKMMKNRQDFIQKNIDDSIISKEEANKIKFDAKNELVHSKIIAQEIISKSKKESEIIRQQYITEGKKEVERLINEANSEIKYKLVKFEETKKDEIIDVAMSISKKIIAKNINKNQLEEYLDSYIKDNQ